MFQKGFLIFKQIFYFDHPDLFCMNFHAVNSRKSLKPFLRKGKKNSAKANRQQKTGRNGTRKLKTHADKTIETGSQDGLAKSKRQTTKAIAGQFSMPLKQSVDQTRHSAASNLPCGMTGKEYKRRKS